MQERLSRAVNTWMPSREEMLRPETSIFRIWAISSAVNVLSAPAPPRLAGSVSRWRKAASGKTSSVMRISSPPSIPAANGTGVSWHSRSRASSADSPFLYHFFIFLPLLLYIFQKTVIFLRFYRLSQRHYSKKDIRRLWQMPHFPLFLLIYPRRQKRRGSPMAPRRKAKPTDYRSA